MRRAVVLLLLLFAACGPGTPSSGMKSPAGNPTPSPAAVSPTPTPASSTPAATTASYAVMVKDFLEGGADYTVYLIALNGHVAASATARKRTTFAQISNLSTSNTTLYYLDGDSDIHFLRPDGTTGLATHIALGPHQVTAFAVRPDDLQIAVSVLDYTRYPVSTRLFVENLHGGANHVELFSSATVMEWPVGWHKGHLVISLGIDAPPQNQFEGFARGHGYHVADAQNGTRLLDVCQGGDSYAPESQAGTVCVQYANNGVANDQVISWDGAIRPVAMDGTCPYVGPLSPAGVIASRVKAVNSGCGGGDVFLVSATGTRDPRSMAQFSSPAGWTDNGHLVVIGDPNVVGPGVTPPPAAAIIDVATGVSATIQAPGFFAEALPGGL